MQKQVLPSESLHLCKVTIYLGTTVNNAESTEAKYPENTTEQIVVWLTGNIGNHHMIGW